MSTLRIMLRMVSVGLLELLYKDGVFNTTRNNLHNHPLPKPSKVPDIVHESVKHAVRCNSSITPGQLNLGNHYYCAIILVLIIIMYYLLQV